MRCSRVANARVANARVANARVANARVLTRISPVPFLSLSYLIIDDC